MEPERILRLTGALLLLASGALHLQLRLDDYGTSDISRAFLLNAALSAVVAAYLVLRPDTLGLLAGIGLSLGTLLAFALARIGDGILDFRETGLNPAPQALLTVLAELAAAISLTAALLWHTNQRLHSNRPK